MATTATGSAVDLSANHSGSVIASTAFGFVVATLAILSRFLARWIANKNLELNDWLILCALPFKYGISVASILLIKFGMGRHIATLSVDQIENYLKTEYVGSFLYAPCIGFIKLSILSLYIAAFPKRWMKIGVWIVSAVVTSWAIACCLVGLFACIPIYKVWDITGTVEGFCIDYHKYYYGLQIPNIATDAVIIAMPIAAVLQLNMSLRETAMMIGVLSIGTLTLIFDVIRLVVLVRTPNTPDISWNQVGASVWTDVEPTVAMLAACMALWRPLLAPRAMYRESRRVHSTRGTRNASTFSMTDDEESTELTAPENKTPYESYSRDISTSYSTQY